MTQETVTNVDLLASTTDIVAAYLSANTVPAADVSAFIAQVHKTLSAVAAGQAVAAEAVRPEPAVAIKKSVTPEYIICLEDGKKLKMLKRHLMTAYNMTPEQYRERWNLPADYPMTAPNYAEKRSALAKSIGLGQKGKVARGRAKKSK